MHMLHNTANCLDPPLPSSSTMGQGPSQRRSQVWPGPHQSHPKKNWNVCIVLYFYNWQQHVGTRERSDACSQGCLVISLVNLHVPSWNRRVVVVKVLPVTLKLLLQLQDSPQLARIVLQWLIPLSAEPIAIQAVQALYSCWGLFGSSWLFSVWNLLLCLLSLLTKLTLIKLLMHLLVQNLVVSPCDWFCTLFY